VTLATYFLLHGSTFAQSLNDSSSVHLPSKYLNDVTERASRIGQKLDARTAKALMQFRKHQSKMQRKLLKIDSTAAKNIFNTAEERFASLANNLEQPKKFSQYVPFLDTLKTSFKFLNEHKTMLGKMNAVDDKLSDGLSKINGLESQLQKAEEVKKFLRQQRQFLKDQLSRFGFAKDLKKLNKEVYYYSEQLKEYKELIRDKRKAERKAVELLSRTKLFQDFMRKNSMLASLFRMPVDDPNDPTYLQSLSGLQTRVQVNQLIQQQVAAGGPNALQQVRNNITEAQSQLQNLKEKMMKAGGGGSSDDDIPEFKANNQKTKSFLKRVEVGTNVQSQKTNVFLPVTSDIGLSLGYKINDKSLLGIGASYKIGWGKSIRQISVTHQGAGLRSFIDYKVKKSFWISGGYEMNYRSAFNDIEQLKNLSAWQQSGLVGISKKLSVNTKFFKSTKVQLLWDFLSYQQVPRTQPVVFRVGYSFSK
jgi:hypothetical protein